MLSVSQGLQLIIETVARLPPREIDLSESLGAVLARDILSDIDSPPFDKSMMDGYAVRAADLSRPRAKLRVVGELTAGRVDQRGLEAGEAIRIMTGAPIPSGADAVVRFEDADFDAATQSVSFRGAGATAGSNIIRRGTSMRAGERVLPAGRIIRAQEIAALAELGQARVTCYPQPSLAVLATGDELVPVAQSPGPGQIRNSNGPMLTAQAVRRGCGCRVLGIAPDEPEELRRLIREGLAADILCLSGGVSAGKLDLVPSALQECGVREVFHKAELKPGKPIWYGALDARQSSDGRPHFVFGLPGNPVSSMVCFELFVRTAINVLAGVEPSLPQPVRARMAAEHRHRDERPTYFPSRLEWTPDGPRVAPVNWKGSSDIRSTVDADAMTLFPPGERLYAVGDEVDVYPW